MCEPREPASYSHGTCLPCGTHIDVDISDSDMESSDTVAMVNSIWGKIRVPKLEALDTSSNNPCLLGSNYKGN